MSSSSLVSQNHLVDSVTNSAGIVNGDGEDEGLKTRCAENGSNTGESLRSNHGCNNQACLQVSKIYRTIKENKSLNCNCVETNCDGPIWRTIDDVELEELMLSVQSKKNQPKNELVHGGSVNMNEWDQHYSFPRLYLTNSLNENLIDPFVLQPSLFHNNRVPPTIYFETKLNDDTRPPIGLPKSLQSFFRWKISSITPNSIRSCISFMKFETIKPANTTDNIYLGSWCKHMLTADFGQLDVWRKVNHYPGSFHLGRKDKLWLRLRLSNRKYKIGEFHPRTFVLPKDYDELKEFWETSTSKLFIMKPPASARGNGIKVINDIAQIPPSALELPKSLDGMPTKKSTMIVQQYISNPCLLENGQKFDLRVYVLLTSVDPLRLYVYDEGLVRFASTKYTMQEDGIIDQYMHLTNYFVNKNSLKYKINNDCDSLSGCKWTLKRFWRYLQEHYDHVDTGKLWDDIVDIIIKTVVACEGPLVRLSNLNCKNDYTSYELFGFDIILDESFKPWILEVNITPSLKSESNLDTRVKYQVIKDMFNLVGYNLPPPYCVDPSRKLSKDCNLWFDERLYTQNLTKRDKQKHSRYQKLFKTESDASQCTTSCRSPVQLDEVSNDETQKPRPKAQATEFSNDTVLPSRNDRIVSEEGSDDEQNQLTQESILNDLSQDDIRVLMLAEDEFSRRGSFRRAFPSEKSSQYLKFFDKPRYYNLLLDAWEQRFGNNRTEGVKLLSYLSSLLD